jgi:hypothetical protein
LQHDFTQQFEFFYLTSGWNSTLSVRCRVAKRGPALEKLIREREGLFEAIRENETRNSKTKPLFTFVKRGVTGVPTGIRTPVLTVKG